MLARVLRSAVPTHRRAVFLATQRAFASYPPHEVVGLPALSPTMEQGNIASWLLKEGDKVSAGDVICQIETDKAVVDYEAQDDMYLAKILVPAGAEGIVVGQPIMVMCEDEDQLEGLKDFKVDESAMASPPAPKAPEEIPPKKEQVPVDPASNAPVVPQDFLVTAQTTAKVTKGTTAPPPVPAAPKPAAAAPAPAATTSFAEKWGHGYKKSPISFSLAKKQQEYIDLYGLTGTTPVSKN